jgi:hypothetical protein
MKYHLARVFFFRLNFLGSKKKQIFLILVKTPNLLNSELNIYPYKKVILFLKIGEVYYL